MKLKGNFVLREIAGECMLVPVGAQTSVTNGIIALSPVAATIWKALSEEKSYEDILAAVLEEYDVTAETAKLDLDEFLSQLRSNGLLAD